ncbi:MAG TPA: hypothetical protein VL752_01300 [Acidisoma sp.]|jgi:hypothetical protein|uniref:hypothetical protein n=1 Tax=Acidisoma sp. TaxID=1872115 RepID=UPI002C944676|nr:hypothetical protein [Acidisoma sp.]HTH99553.1 hypothetical protein [Acidisoma sp.]
MSIVISTKFGPITLSELSLSMGCLSGNVTFSRDFDDSDANRGGAAVMCREAARQLAERFEVINKGERERPDREREQDGQAGHATARQEAAQ